MAQVLISQQYDIAAAHRLHAAGLNDQQNVDQFGKCNNPAGHGHNYRLEVTVRAGEGAPAVETLDALVDRLVIQRLDHKNLNCDVPQFANLTTTVENIAKVIYEMLEAGLGDSGFALDQVRVWETDKTYCTYRRD